MMVLHRLCLLMIRRPPRSTLDRSSAASDVYKRQVRTIPATIAAELGEAPFGGLHFKALFALACILFIITLITNLLVERMSANRRTS